MSASRHVANGPLIRQLRRARLLTQDELGALIGVGQPVISSLEHMRAGQPPWLGDLARALGTRVPDLLIPAGSVNGEALTALPAPDETYWTTGQAAGYLGLSRQIVTRLTAEGLITAEHAGRSWRLVPASVRAYKRHPRKRHLQTRHPRPGELPVSRHRLRQLRRDRGLTQLELAGQAGLKRSTVSMLETGHQATTTVLPALAEALGVGASELTADQTVPDARHHDGPGPAGPPDASISAVETGAPCARGETRGQDTPCTESPHRRECLTMSKNSILRTVKLDPSSPAHTYLQLAAILRQQIQHGEITSRLPSLTTLVQQTGLAPGTVRRAIDVLVSEHLVQTVPGRGTFVQRRPGT